MTSLARRRPQAPRDPRGRRVARPARLGSPTGAIGASTPLPAHGADPAREPPAPRRHARRRPTTTSRRSPRGRGRRATSRSCRARADAGLHRRAGGRRPRRDAKRRRRGRRRPAHRQPARAGRPRDRPFRAGRPVPHRPTPTRPTSRSSIERNGERYRLLRWAQGAFDNVRVVPPGAGICHQVNLEHLGQVVSVRDGVAFPDTVVGTDSHTTMINGLGVLGWGVGGIEAEAAMLGQPIALPQPIVVGVRTIGALPAGHDGDRSRADADADAPRARRGRARSWSSSATGSRRCRSPIARRCRTCAPNTGRPRRTSRSTTRRSPTCGSPVAADAADLAERYAKEQGLFRTDGDPGADVHRGPRARSLGGRALAGRAEAAAGPRRAARRLGLVRRGVPRARRARPEGGRDRRVHRRRRHRRDRSVCPAATTCPTRRSRPTA